MQVNAPEVLNTKAAGWAALLISVAGILTHPEILGLLPENVAIIISTLGIVLQGITKNIWGK